MNNPDLNEQPAACPPLADTTGSVWADAIRKEASRKKFPSILAFAQWLKSMRPYLKIGADGD
jgi:hypothetical protein